MGFVTKCEKRTEDIIICKPDLGNRQDMTFAVDAKTQKEYHNVREVEMDIVAAARTGNIAEAQRLKRLGQILSDELFR